MNTRKKRPRKQSTYINVPNLFTALNVLCGFVSVIQTVEGNYVTAAWLIFFSAVFDALDGRIARATGQSNAFGLQMDSLGDVISAGLAPAVLVYVVQLKTLHPPLGLILAFFPVLFAAFRLARFNVFTMAEGKKADYLGLPAPMAGVTLAGCVILADSMEWTLLLRSLIVMVPVVSLLMASTIRYEGFPRFSIKEKGPNRFKLIFFVFVFVAFLIYPSYVLFPFMIVYILSGIFKAILALLRNGDDGVITIIPEADDLNSEH
ncbi:MAG TPA: CDP-diacylglycerol--serine O-phosphatidyltransferase [bacterium]|nr:CDP-diacylglycerol--serine O-phosphatidyltransferase [bacterium]HPR86796.1 CDP-diacylglycerol--serine O-phosphatidyltransferase [bacterium]